MRKEIINYLKGPRPWVAGVALYLKYGHNLMLRKTFMHRMETADLRVTLIEELRKLAGLSTTELSQLKRCASQGTEKAELPGQSPGPQDKAPTEASPTVKKMIRFREKFKFLNQPDCPDELKVLVSDMFTALGKYKDAHAKLAAMPDDADLAEAARLAEECVENYLANREMWEELEYYQAHGEVLGKCAKLRALKEAQDIAALDDLELARRYSSAQANTSKQRKRLKEAEKSKDEGKITAAREALTKWEAKSAALREELEKRKKN